MILRANKLELAVLILHMSIMRKNIKKGFKSNYKSDKGKGVLTSFDTVKTTLQEGFEALEDEINEVDLHFNIVEVNTLSSFIDWYISEVDLTFEAAGKKVQKADQEQMELLKEVKTKIDVLKIEYV